MSDTRDSKSFVLFKKEVSLSLAPPRVEARHKSRVEDYLKKAEILKQIMSNKARRYRAINATQNVITVVVSGSLVFIGFSGMDKVTEYASRLYPIDRSTTELVFNLLVLAIFMIGVLHLIFHFPNKQASAERAVAQLAALGNEIEDGITSQGNLIISDDPARVSLIRTRYEAIAENIPANSDREFIRAKRDMAAKEIRKPRFHIDLQELFDQSKQEQIVSSIILGSRTIVDVLVALRKEGVGLYLGGGLIRNAVWDFLHGYRSPTPVDDVDIVYFDKLNDQKHHDLAINRSLTDKIPNLRWSAKNQARMHIPNSESAYDSLDDAISKWPETATAVAVRLDDDGKLLFIDPYGFDDLLRMIVVPTPNFHNKVQVVLDRVNGKGWLETWPRLRLIGL